MKTKIVLLLSLCNIVIFSSENNFLDDIIINQAKEIFKLKKYTEDLKEKIENLHDRINIVKKTMRYKKNSAKNKQEIIDEKRREINLSDIEIRLLDKKIEYLENKNSDLFKKNNSQKQHIATLKEANCKKRIFNKFVLEKNVLGLDDGELIEFIVNDKIITGYYVTKNFSITFDPFEAQNNKIPFKSNKENNKKKFMLLKKQIKNEKSPYKRKRTLGGEENPLKISQIRQ